LDNDQWNFHEDSTRWSIGEIVEHLILQEQAYWRELYVVSLAPELPQYIETVKGNDEQFLAYASDPTPGKAGWYIQPTGRFCHRVGTIEAFMQVRSQVIDLINDTEADYRKHFTFRKYPQDGLLSDPGLWDVRDLHQLMLTNIAHNDRHLHQLRKVKLHENYPTASGE